MLIGIVFALAWVYILLSPRIPWEKWVKIGEVHMTQRASCRLGPPPTDVESFSDSMNKGVYPNVNLASHKFYSDWEKWWGDSAPVAQPQVDLIFVSSDLRLFAVELKYYRPGKNSPTNQSYYSGIEETLALLKFGFTCVSLWHFFDAEVPDEIMRSYVRDCNGLILGLGLRINYKAFRVHGRQEVDFKGITPMSKMEVQPDFSTYGTSNPLVDNTYAKKAADFVRRALRIPTP